MAELAYAAASRAALLWVQLPPGLPEFLCSLTIQRRVGRTVRHLSAKQGLSQEANGFDSRTLRHAEGTAEPEKQKGNANRATLAVARKMVAYLLAVDRGQRDFVAFADPQSAAA